MERHLITGEDPNVHWPFLNVKDEIVLDLGSGGCRAINYTTPVFFKNKGASKVIAVDSSHDDFLFLTENIKDPDYVILEQKINKTKDLLKLIEEYSPTVIKCDIEGDEYHAFQDITKSDLSGINQIAIEFHSHEIFIFIYKKFSEWGFKVHTFAHFGTDEVWNSADRQGVLYGIRDEVIE